MPSGGKVLFLGYKNQDVSALQQMSNTPILAEHIESHSSDLNNTTEAYRLLRYKREIEAAKLNNIVINVEVSRNSLYALEKDNSNENFKYYLNSLRRNNLNRVILAQLNINSM